MEQYNVKLLRRAVQDLDDIYSYIAQSLLEPGNSLPPTGAVGDAIFFEALPCSVPGAASRHLRKPRLPPAFVEGYTIIFRIEESKKQVVVVTVRSSLRQ